MRKGFLHVVEIIIVSAMVLLILQLAYAPKQAVDWQSLDLYTQANDVLFSLDRKGVDWFNSTEVNDVLSSSFSNSTIFSLKITNAIKPQIKVGCLGCDGTQVSNLNSALKSFQINGQTVTFSVAAVSAFSHDYDVMVAFGPIADSQYDQSRQFLAAGKGIVEFRHLASGDINSVQTGLFGIIFNLTLQNPDSTRIEFRSDDSSGSYYNIYKYFHNIPLYQNNFTSAADITSWTVQSPSWSQDSGNYLGSGTDAISYYNIPFQGNYSLRTWLSFPASSPATTAKLILYRQDPSNYVSVIINRSSNTIAVWENSSGVSVSMGSVSYVLSTGVWYDVKIIAQEDRSLRIYVNGSRVLTSQPVSSIPPSSQIAFGAENGQVRFDNLRVAFSEKHTFSQVLQAGEKIWPADNRMENIILFQKSMQLPACIVNSNIADGKGRTAWLSYADPAGSQEISNMLRDLVVWTAGDENEVVRNDVKNVPVVVSLYRTYDQDMYQPVEVVLTMGNLYG
jgi:hypothetical protein